MIGHTCPLLALLALTASGCASIPDLHFDDAVDGGSAVVPAGGIDAGDDAGPEASDGGASSPSSPGDAAGACATGQPPAGTDACCGVVPCVGSKCKQGCAAACAPCAGAICCAGKRIVCAASASACPPANGAGGDARGG